MLCFAVKIPLSYLTPFTPCFFVVFFVENFSLFLGIFRNSISCYQSAPWSKCSLRNGFYIGFLQLSGIQKCVQCSQKHANELETPLGNPWRRNEVYKLLRTTLVWFFHRFDEWGAPTPLRFRCMQNSSQNEENPDFLNSHRFQPTPYPPNRAAKHGAIDLSRRVHILKRKKNRVGNAVGAGDPSKL